MLEVRLALHELLYWIMSASDRVYTCFTLIHHMSQVHGNGRIVLSIPIINYVIPNRLALTLGWPCQWVGAGIGLALAIGWRWQSVGAGTCNGLVLIMVWYL